MPGLGYLLVNRNLGLMCSALQASLTERNDTPSLLWEIDVL